MKRSHTLLALLWGFSAAAAGDVTKPSVQVTVSTSGRAPMKPAWEWSDEERIRVRFGPASVRERAAAHAARAARERVIDGSRDPALFLPAELLDVLLQGLHADASIRAHARTALAPEIRAMGYTENDFWGRLERLSTRYRALSSRPGEVTIQRATRADGQVVSFPVDVERCAARHDLLQAARASFGAQTFQRFLYAAVAPQVQRAVTTQQIDPAQELLFVAGGCRR